MFWLGLAIGLIAGICFMIWLNYKDPQLVDKVSEKAAEKLDKP